MSRKKILLIILLLAFFAPRAYASVVINEFQIEPTTNQWVELFNKGIEVIDISGWVIDDSGGTEKFIIPDNTNIATASFEVFKSGKFNFNSATVDKVRLFSKDNSLIDSKEYPGSPGSNVTIGRYPDGGDNWGICSPTPSGNNNCVAPTATPTVTTMPTATLTPTALPKPTHTPTPSPTPKIPTATPTTTLTIKTESKPIPTIGVSVMTPKPTFEIATEEAISSMVIDNDHTASSPAEQISTASSEILGIGTVSSSLKKTKIPFNYFLLFAGMLFLVGSLSLLYTAKQHEKNSKH